MLYGGADPPMEKDYSSLGEMMLARLKIGGSKLAFVDGITAEELTFGQLLKRSVLLARCMKEYGIVKNDVVSVVSENRLEYPAIVFAAIYLGATVAPINLTYTESK